MRTRLTFVLFAMAASSAAAAQTTDKDRADVTQVEDAWRKARIDGDVGFLDRFYAKEGRIPAMDGKVKTREEDIALFATGKVKPKFLHQGTGTERGCVGKGVWRKV